ncbi:MAG TPA: hypothetical protein VHM90_06795 [Phycisphaerae bacterium]|nr:hypothetical protein [Phycisphaerae bacterium]
METGPNEGVTPTGAGIALISMDAGDGAVFDLVVDEFGGRLSAAVIRRTGYGDAQGSSTYRLGDDEGSWRLSGRTRGDKRPLPKYLASATGSVRFVKQAVSDNQGNTAAVSYLQFAAVFTFIEFKHQVKDQGGEDAWQVEFTCTKNGPVTQAWDGADGDGAAGPALPAPAGGKPWNSTRSIHEGAYTIADPAVVSTAAREVIDVVGVPNTRAGDNNVLVTLEADGVSPVSGLKLARKSIRRTDTNGARAVLDWEIDNARDRIQNGGQVSTRSAVEAFTRTAIEFLDTTSDCETVADIYWPTFQAEDFSQRLTVRKINNVLAMITKEYVNPGIGLVADTFGLAEYQIGRVNSGSVQVYVARKLQRGSGRYEYRLGRSRQTRVARSFTIRRSVNAGTVPDFNSLVDTVNNATFLGLSAGGVAYRSAHVDANIGLTDSYSMDMLYRFEWISGGHYQIDGWAARLLNTASVGTGWQNVSAFSGSGDQLAATTPSQSDFSVFLGAIP